MRALLIIATAGCLMAADKIVTTNGSADGGLKESSLTGIIKAASGVPSAASAGTDYVVPGGNVATATALASNPANCTSGNLPRGVDAAGAGEGCAAVSLSTEVTGTLPAANVATAAADGSTKGVATFTAADFDASTGLISLDYSNGQKATGSLPGFLSAADWTTFNGKLSAAGNAATATALAVNGANCSAGSFPLGVDASGASETCTALPTTITGTANQITASAATGAITLSIPTSPAFTTPTITTSETLTNNLAANTSGDGYVVQNSGTASSGNQMFSPRINRKAAGWKTASTAGSQVFSFVDEVIPIQGSANPSGSLVFKSSVNGGAYTTHMSLWSDGIGNGTLTFPAATTISATTLCAPVSVGNYCSNTAGKITLGTGSGVVIAGGSTGVAYVVSTGLRMRLDNIVGFSSTTDPTSNTDDISIDRDAAGILGVVNGTQGTTAANYRAIKASAYYSGGTTFTASGCSNGTLVGGATAGTFVSGTTGACTVTITMGNSATAPTGWHCAAANRTTGANLMQQTASTTTTCTISGTTVTSDVISFFAIGY